MNNLLTDKLVGSPTGEAFADAGKVLRGNAEETGVPVYIKVGLCWVVQVLHEPAQDVLAGTIGLVHQFIILEVVQVVQVVGHRGKEQAQAEFLVWRFGTGEMIAKQIEVKSEALHRHFICMQYLVGRGEHGMCPLHAHQLRELSHIFRREEKHQCIEVHAHHAILKDIARLAGNNVTFLQLIGLFIDRELGLSVCHQRKEETFYEDIGDIDVTHLIKVAEKCNMFIAMKMKSAVGYSLKV